MQTVRACLAASQLHFAWRSSSAHHSGVDLSFVRKEVIQPQVLLRLPCYDFTPIMSHTLGACLLAVSVATSSTAHFRDVTGGVYKARERIHGVDLIRHYQRFRLHAVELQTAIRTERAFFRLAPPRGLATVCNAHCNTCVALDIKAMRT